MGFLVHGNALLALAAAVLWGGGDFSGGMGVKGAGGTMGAALRVILLSHSVSLGFCWWWLGAGRCVSAWGSAGLGAGGGSDGGSGAGLLLCGAVAGSDGGFGGAERVAGGGDSGGGVGWGRRGRRDCCGLWVLWWRERRSG